MAKHDGLFHFLVCHLIINVIIGHMARDSWNDWNPMKLLKKQNIYILDPGFLDPGWIFGIFLKILFRSRTGLS